MMIGEKRAIRALEMTIIPVDWPTDNPTALG
jgi:hypothetical protein